MTARRRLRGVLAVSLLVVVAGWVFDPGGLTGLLLQGWSLLSLPAAAVAGCLLAVLRNPESARDVVEEQGTLVGLGLLMLSWLARTGESNPLARAAWQLLFDEVGPTGTDYRFGSGEDAVDLSMVRRVRRFVGYAAVASVAVAVLDSATTLSDSGGTGPQGLGAYGVGLNPGGPVEAVVFATVAVLAGAVVGFLFAVIRQ